MMVLDVETHASWRGWFRLPRLNLFHVATQNKQRALVCYNATGVEQLYAYDLHSGSLRQLTVSDNGTRVGTLSADGQTVYYLEDAQGGDIGHFFRMGYDGSDPTDLMPEWPAYTSFQIAESASGNFYGFMTLNQLGYQMFVVEVRTGGAPHLRYESQDLSLGPFLSYDAELAVVLVIDERGHTLESYDVRTGQRVAALTSAALIEPGGFVPRAHDMRLLAVSLESGLRRAFIWNARTGERRDLPFSEYDSIIPLDWSADGEQIVSMAYGLQGASVSVYNLKTNYAAAIGSLQNHNIEAAHWHAGALWTLAQQYHQPSMLLRDGLPQLRSADLAPVPTLPPVTVHQRGHLTHYEQPSEWGVLLAHVDEYATPQRYLPAVNAWLMAGAAVTVWFSLANHGMLPGNLAGAAVIQQEALEIRKAVSTWNPQRRYVLVANQLAALSVWHSLPLPLNVAALVLVDAPAAGSITLNSSPLSVPLLLITAEGEHSLADDMRAQGVACTLQIIPHSHDRPEHIHAFVLQWLAISANASHG